MKKRIVLLCMIGVLCLATGCGKQTENNTENEKETEVQEKEETEEEVLEETEEVPEEVKPELALGEETETAVSVILTNKSGQDIKNFWVKASGTEEWSADYLEGKEPYSTEQEAILYFEPAVSENGSTADTGNVMVEISVTYADGSTAYLHDLNLGDMERLDICREENVSYAVYTSLLTTQEVNMKETEMAIIAQQEAEAAAKQEAEEAAKREAEEAAKAKSSNSNSSNKGSNNSSNNNGWADNASNSGSSSGGGSGSISQNEDSCSGGSGNYIINEDGSWTYVE